MDLVYNVEILINGLENENKKKISRNSDEQPLLFADRLLLIQHNERFAHRVKVAKAREKSEKQKRVKTEHTQNEPTIRVDMYYMCVEIKLKRDRCKRITNKMETFRFGRKTSLFVCGSPREKVRRESRVQKRI